MTSFLPRGIRWLEVGAILALFLVIHVSANETDLATTGDCYYNYNHYSEGDRILTNEPCLNCTCHNKMLMCYLKVCPFTKPIGQDCTIEKREDQCCPIITCPEVPVELDHSSGQSTDMATHLNHGCTIEDQWFPEGAQIPGNPKKPCELCYCIRNMTSCVMQECTLHVDGCRPIYNKGVCCPVRYDCARDEELPLMLEDQTTTEAPSQGFIITTTSAPVQSSDCYHNSIRYHDGELIETEHACEHCYCMRGDIVCAVQECKPLEMHGKNCTAAVPGPDECCPSVYECDSDIQSTSDEPSATTLGYKEIHAEAILTTTQEAISSEHIEKEAITTEGAIIDSTSARIDESENEIHDKDYDHLAAKPSRNITAQKTELDGRIESEDSTTLLSKLDEVAATTILSESAGISEQITTVLPIVHKTAEKESNENESTEGILSNLYTTIKSIVDFTTTLSPLHEQPPKAHDEEDSFISNVIPGEGDCLDNGVSYANNTNVQPRNVCEESCICHNSIVRCEEVRCAPMPPNAENCKILQEPGLCCPSYHCESMEFNTGTAPTHPAENQVMHEDHIDSTTQSDEIESQTDSKVDSSTQSAGAPISSKFDDSSELKPEVSTEAKAEEQTTSHEIESSTSAKVHDEIVSVTEDVKAEIENKLGAEQPIKEEQTEEPIKEEIVTEAKYEPESTTLEAAKIDESHEPESPKPEIVESEPAQPTTEKAADELPQEIPTTQLPETESEHVTDGKLHDEIQPTTQAAAEITTQRQMAQSEESSSTETFHEISTESQPTPEEEQKQDDYVTMVPSIEQVHDDADISTEAQPAVAQHDDHPQPDEHSQEESVTTEAPSSQKQQDTDISTEALQEIATEAQPEEKPEQISTETQPIAKPEEISTEAQPIAKPEEIATETQPIAKPEEISTEAQPIGEPEEISTETQPIAKPEEISTEAQPIAKPEEISTEAQPIAKPEEISTEAQLIVKPEEISTEAQPIDEAEDTKSKEITTEQTIHKTEEPSEQSTESLPDTVKHDEHVTEQAPEIPMIEEKQSTEAAMEAATTEKLAEEQIDMTTARASDIETPVKLAPFEEVSSTEKQIEEQQTERVSENMIPDSSTDGHIEQHADMSTEKHIEPAEKHEDEPITTEKSDEQKPTEAIVSQTTQGPDSKLVEEIQKIEEQLMQTTAAPKPIVDDIEVTEKQPELHEMSSEHEPLSIEDHHTENDIIAPATESQASVTEHIQPEIVDTKEEIVTEDGFSSSEYTHIYGQQSPETPTTEHIVEEQTTLSSSKLNIDEATPSDVKADEITPEEKIEAVTTEKSEEEIPSATIASEQPEQPEKTSSEVSKEAIATEEPAPIEHDAEITQAPAIATEAPAPIEHDAEITQAPAIAEEKEHSTTEKQSHEATTTYVFPSKQEDLDIITDIPSKQEDLEIVTSRQDETKEESTTAFAESSHASSSEPSSTTLKSEEHEIVSEEVTESKVESEPSTEGAIETESTTVAKAADEEQPKPAIEEIIPSEEHVDIEKTTSAPSEEKIEQIQTEAPEQSEQTTFGVIAEKSTEATEIKQEPIPTTEQPERPELESGSHVHLADEQPHESPVTTEASKQDEIAATTTATASIENLNRLGEEQTRETTVKSEEAPQIVTESAEIVHEHKRPHIHLASTPASIIDVTTLLNKIHDAAVTTEISSVEEITTHRQEQPEQPEQSEHTEQPQQQTEQPQQQTEEPQQPAQTEQAQEHTELPQDHNEQPESTSAPVHEEKPEIQSADEFVTTERVAMPEVSDATTQAAHQPEQFDESIDATTAAQTEAPTEDVSSEDVNRIHEIPSEVTTEQPHIDQTTQGIESSSAHEIVESAHNQFDETVSQEHSSQSPVEEQTTSHAVEEITEAHIQSGEHTKEEAEMATQKEFEHESTEGSIVPEAPIDDSHDSEIAPVIHETTAYEHEISPTTSEPIKSPEIVHEELPAEVSTEHIEQEATKATILEGTTIKSVVELLTTLYPKESIQQEPELTTAQPAESSTEHDGHYSPIYNRVDADSSSTTEQEYHTTESAPAPVQPNKEMDEQQTFQSPPESANNIPLIREPMPELSTEMITKLAESFDMTTLPSILTSSHTERISDSTTIKNTQNEIIETTPHDGLDSVAQHETHEMPESHETQPSYPSSQPFDSGYGNVPSQYPDEEYTDEEEPTAFGPGTCRYGGKLYVSAQQIPRDDPCDFCFCFRSDIICLQQSCPPPINNCHEEPIQGFCCPRYECPVSMALVLNTTTTTTTLPPYLSHFRNSGRVTKSACQVQGLTYNIGEKIQSASGPCIDCICGGDGQMKCELKVCKPEPMLRQMIASARRR